MRNLFLAVQVLRVKTTPILSQTRLPAFLENTIGSIKMSNHQFSGQDNLDSSQESHGSMFTYVSSSSTPTPSDMAAKNPPGTVAEVTTESITVKDFFDFMKTAYQVYAHLEGEEEGVDKIDWEQLTKLTVLNHVIDQGDRDLLYATTHMQPKMPVSKSSSTLENERLVLDKRFSSSELELRGRNRRRSLPTEARVEMLGIWTETNLICKLNDVMNEGILDSILPYLAGYKKPTRITSDYIPIIKKQSILDVKKPDSFSGFLHEKESRDRIGRRKSSIKVAQEKLNQKQEGDVEIHVCDEVKGLKQDFRCSQKLLVSKMGYFADVTAGQRLEDMDISVHCDIQIFDWLMRWVKKDTILIADWPLLEPGNVVPILVSASFLQMEPLLQDCMIYCHAHLNEIVKTSTNLACLSDALLNRLAAMYTNVELEAVKDRKDKIHTRLYCKMILSLAEPVPETLRGHYSTLATLFKCSKCNKLLGSLIAEQVPCQPACMRIDRRGNIISNHIKDSSWNLNEYIRWLFGELRSWRRVYWRLWAECHFLKCLLCDTYFPAYQMEWCSYHEQGPQLYCAEGRALPAGRYPCCGERAYRFEPLTRNTGCQFREHLPDDRVNTDAAVMEIYNKYRELIAMRPPELVFPERLTRLLPRVPEEEQTGRLQCKEVFWWEGIQLVPPRQPLGLLGKLYTSNNKFNPIARPGSATLGGSKLSCQSVTVSSVMTPEGGEPIPSPKAESPKSRTEENIKIPIVKKGATNVIAEAADDDDGGEQSSESSETESDTNEASDASEEDALPRKNGRKIIVPKSPVGKKRTRVVGRQWVASLSARSNQDGQRRFEERAVRQMRAALARRAAMTTVQKPSAPPGGVYAKLEAEWRERHGPKPRVSLSARPKQAIKYK